MSEHDDDNKDPFQSLLQGKAAWWHFLDAKAQGDVTQEAQAGKASLELEMVGRWAEQAASKKRPKFMPHFTASLRCQSCQAQVPADLTFCVYCGDVPGFERSYSDQVLVIDHIEDADIFSEVVDLIIHSNSTLDPREIWSALAQPPAVFFFHGHDEHAEALVDRLSEIGVRSTVTRQGNSDVSMVREIAESALRDKRVIAGSLAIVGLAIVLSMSMSPNIGVIFGLIALGALSYYQSLRFSKRYDIKVVSILNELTGFSEDMVSKSQRALRALEDDEVNELLTICLMEYYAIWRQLASARPEVRRLLVGLKDNLDHLMEHILDACLQYSQLYSYALNNKEEDVQNALKNAEDAIEQAVDEQTIRLAVRERESRQKQLKNIEHVKSVLPTFRTRLLVMCSSLESLRARVVAVTMSREQVSSEEILMSEILNELDDEVTIFEQTLEEAIEAAGVRF